MWSKLKTQNSATSGNLSCMLAVGLFSFGFPAANSLLETWGLFSLITVRNLLGFLFLVGLMAFKLGIGSQSRPMLIPLANLGMPKISALVAHN